MRRLECKTELLSTYEYGRITAGHLTIRSRCKIVTWTIDNIGLVEGTAPRGQVLEPSEGNSTRPKSTLDIDVLDGRPEKVEAESLAVEIFGLEQPDDNHRSGTSLLLQSMGNGTYQRIGLLTCEGKHNLFGSEFQMMTVTIV